MHLTAGHLPPPPLQSIAVRKLVNMYSWIVSFMSVACTAHNNVRFIFLYRKSRLTLIHICYSSKLRWKHFMRKPTHMKRNKYVHVKVLNFLLISVNTSWTQYKWLLYKDIPFLFQPKRIIIIPNPPLFRSTLSLTKTTTTIFNNLGVNSIVFFNSTVQALGYAS